MRAQEHVVPWAKLDKILATLEQATQNDDFERIRDILIENVAGFVPQCEIEDLLWKENKRLVNG
jgi:hypothetical protein